MPLSSSASLSLCPLPPQWQSLLLLAGVRVRHSELCWRQQLWRPSSLEKCMAFISIFVVYVIAFYLNHNGQNLFSKEKRKAAEEAVPGLGALFREFQRQARTFLQLQTACGFPYKESGAGGLQDLVVSLWFIWDIIQTFCEEGPFPMDPPRNWQIKQGGK